MHKISRDEHLIDALAGVSSTNDSDETYMYSGTDIQRRRNSLNVVIHNGRRLMMLCYVGSLYEESCSCEHVELFTE